MRRGIVTAAAILISFLLQTSVFDLFKLAGTAPNVLLILVVSVAVMRGHADRIFQWADAGHFLWFLAGRLCLFVHALGVCRRLFSSDLLLR